MSINIIGKIGQVIKTTRNTDKGILFLYPEAKGFDVHELNGNNKLPTQEDIDSSGYDKILDNIIEDYEEETKRSVAWGQVSIAA